MQFENFKTSRETINQEMLEQVHAIFCLSYSQQCGVHASMLAAFYQTLRGRTFWLTFRAVAHFCQTFNQIRVAFKIFWFLEFILLSCSTLLWFEVAKRLSAILFLFSNLALASVSIEGSVMHSTARSSFLQRVIFLLILMHITVYIHSQFSLFLYTDEGQHKSGRNVSF